MLTHTQAVTPGPAAPSLQRRTRISSVEIPSYPNSVPLRMLAEAAGQEPSWNPKAAPNNKAQQLWVSLSEGTWRSPPHRGCGASTLRSAALGEPLVTNLLPSPSVIPKAGGWELLGGSVQPWEVGERSFCRGHRAPSPLLLLLLESPFFWQPSSREFSEKLPTGSNQFFQSLTLHIPHITGIPRVSKLLQRANSSR